MSTGMEGKMPRKEMDPELKAIIAHHKPRDLKFPSSKSPETLETIFGGKSGVVGAKLSAEILAQKDNLKDN